jgi:nucleoside-diphosphate-sugar epimerase
VTSSYATILITGASGFLGSEILRLALASGWQVRAFVRNWEGEGKGVELVRGDITDLDAVRKACENVSAVVHAAGLAHVFRPRENDLARFLAVNENGTANVVRAAVELAVPKVVLASSVSVYGSYSGVECNETAPCYPQSYYAMSKLLGEQRAIELMANSQGSLRILRLATIYGEGDLGNVSKLISALEKGRFIWPGDGLNRKSLIYKADAARACLRALEDAKPGADIFNVSAQPVTMREIVSAICQALGRPVPRLVIPSGSLKVATTISRSLGDPGQLGRRLEKFIRDDVYNSSKFANACNFVPVTSLMDGIRREVSFQCDRSTCRH